MVGNGGTEPNPVGWRPVPDPTVLTTEALARETAGLRRELEWLQTYFAQEINLLREIYTVKIEAVIHTDDERFDRIKDQFRLIEEQREEQKSDTQKAVDAALAAQKEAVREQTIASQTAIDKSENNLRTQLDQQGETFTTALDGLRREDQDMKERISRIENQRLGGEAKVSSIYALAAFVSVIVGIAVVIIAFVN